MQSMMFKTNVNSLFKADSQKSEPFPPAYYENKKRATELITRMSDPKTLNHKKT